MLDLPDSIKKRINTERYSLDEIGMSDANVLLFDDTVLKIQTPSRESSQELLALDWLYGKLPVPKIIANDEVQEKSYLLMERCPGQMACDNSYLSQPERLISALANILKQLWTVDVSDFPYSYSLRDKLEEATRNVEDAKIDINEAELGTFGPDAFDNPQALLKWLISNQPDEELVFSHGDFCLPNIFLRNEQLTGLIDLGRAGIGDKYCDIALAYRSLKHNMQTFYGNDIDEVYNPLLLFEHLGMEANWDKINYYILLDELF